jgi:hypothetical protein
MAFGFHCIDGKYYYFSTSTGAMKTGEITVPAYVSNGLLDEARAFTFDATHGYAVDENGNPLTTLEQVDPITYPCFVEKDGKWLMDWADFEEKLQQCDLFLLCNPHNPLGIVWEAEELKRMVDLCIKYHVPVFSDEIHSVVYGHVYTLRDGRIVEIYTKQGSDYHAGGFFAWYLIPVANSDYYNLAEETFGMWQGVGTVTYREYLLTDEGYEIDVNYLELDSEDAGNHDDYGMVTEEAWNAYGRELNRELGKCYRIYCSSSNGSGSMALDTAPAYVFAQ